MGNIFCCDEKEPPRHNAPNTFNTTNTQQISYPTQTSQPIRSQPTAYPSYDSFAREQAREEEEHRRKMEEIRKRNEQRTNEMKRNFERDNRDDELSRRRQEEERQADFQRQLDDNREDNARKDWEKKQQVEQFAEGLKMTGYVVDERRQLELEREQADIEKILRDNQLRHDKEMAGKRREFDYAEREHQARMQAIDDSFHEKQEQLLREAEYKQREMQAQFEQILRMIQMRVWNEIIESNWTNRLNTLRNANRDSQRLERLCLGGRPDVSKLQEWSVVLDILLNMMKEESQNMSIMYNNTGKKFLLTIKAAVDNVSYRCQNLLDAVHSSQAENMKRLSHELNTSCSAIPTLAELKNSYYSEMHN